MYETCTIAVTPPSIGCSILSSPPTYDGIDADEYIEWESKIDNIFAQCRMCEQRKIKNATSILNRTNGEMVKFSKYDKPTKSNLVSMTNDEMQTCSSSTRIASHVSNNSSCYDH